MQIVIDIPEEMYNEVIANDMVFVIDDIDCILIETIIANGIPLPKGHEDLIDRGEVIKSLFDYHNGKKTIGQCIDDVQTIIEADKESD